MSCRSPEMLESVTDWARRADQPAPAAVERHLSECAACQSEVERMARLTGTWQVPALSNAEILRLRLRVLGRVRGSRGAPARRRAGAIGIFALGALTAVTALATSGLLSPPETSRGPETTETAPRATPPAPVALTARGVEPGIEENDGAPAAEPAVRPEPPRATSSARPPREDPRWAAAAEALRNSDEGKAEQALGALTTSRDAATRDSASLALAELWLKAGDRERARPVLERLAASGATPLVRRRAAALLK